MFSPHGPPFTWPRECGSGARPAREDSPLFCRAQDLLISYHAGPRLIRRHEPADVMRAMLSHTVRSRSDRARAIKAPPRSTITNTPPAPAARGATDRHAHALTPIPLIAALLATRRRTRRPTHRQGAP